MSLRLPSSLVGAFLVLAAACSHEISKPPPASDGPAEPGGAVGGGSTTPVTDGGLVTDSGTDAATACNDLALTGALVDQSAVAGDPQVGQGGSVADGNYDLTDASLFIGAGSSGATGTTFKESISLNQGTLQQFRQTQASTGNSELRATYTVAVSGTTITLTPTCPSGAPQQWTFTVNGSQLRLTSLTQRVEFVYTKK